MNTKTELKYQKAHEATQKVIETYQQNHSNQLQGEPWYKLEYWSWRLYGKEGDLYSRSAKLKNLEWALVYALTNHLGQEAVAIAKVAKIMDVAGYLATGGVPVFGTVKYQVALDDLGAMVTIKQARHLIDVYGKKDKAHFTQTKLRLAKADLEDFLPKSNHTIKKWRM